ncbi:hypothetical protein AVEN_99699-1 [Araneus ventricosus]|uniref:DDE-1 domain-containing protein n=1 Tax=Araneus ventricosus TaxID=182803 RepID=A0A4Y2KBL4_ARAVE|nr:hypothetical protein AVEN_99699-1 [Araneus ventricosus]
MDNAPAHPPNLQDYLLIEIKFVKTLFLPPNNTPLLQNMDHRFCLGASDGRVLVRRRPGERLQPTCLRTRHTGLIHGVMVWRAISYDSRNTLVVLPLILTANFYASLVIQPVVLPFMNSIQGGVFQQYNARSPTAVVTQHALQSANMLPRSSRSPDLSPIEHVWDIIGIPSGSR